MRIERLASDTFTVITSCPICDSRALRRLQTRSDGVPVLQCERCQMGFVERYPADLDAYYADDYYAAEKAGETQRGYVDYNLDAAHALSWAIYLIRMLRSTGRVLDIGCANGYLLKGLGPDFSRFGIEVNSSMVQACQAAGISIIAQDIKDPKLTANYRAGFDIITGMAVLEHVSDIRAALSQIKSLLAPGGIFLFEVPLISETHDNTNWYTSSLEHVYYPTIAGLHYLFETVFGLPLIGGEVVIRNYCSTFVGLMGGDQQTHDLLAELYRHLIDSPISALQNQQEQTFRFLFDVIHAATTTSAVVALLPRIDPSVLTPGVLDRVSAIWQLDLKEPSSSWKAEADHLSLLLDQQRAWTAELERGKAWLEQQQLNWQAEVNHVIAMSAEQQDWIKELERTKAWLEEQRSNWQAESQRRDTLLAEQQHWIAELEHGKAWLEGQVASWQAEAEQTTQNNQQLQQNYDLLVEQIRQREEQRLSRQLRRVGSRVRRLIRS